MACAVINKLDLEAGALQTERQKRTEVVVDDVRRALVPEDNGAASQLRGETLRRPVQGGNVILRQGDLEDRDANAEKWIDHKREFNAHASLAGAGEPL